MKRSLLMTVTAIIAFVFSFDAEGRFFSEIGSSFSGVGSRIKAKVDDIRGIAPYMRDLKNLQKSLSDFGNATRSVLNELNNIQAQFIITCNACLALTHAYCQTIYKLANRLIEADSAFRKASKALSDTTALAQRAKAEEQQQNATAEIADAINVLVGPDIQMARYYLKIMNSGLIIMMKMGVYPSGDPTRVQRRIDTLSKKGSGITTASQTFEVAVENIMNEVNITQMETTSGEPPDSQAIRGKAADAMDLLQLQMSFVNVLKRYLNDGGRSITEQEAQELLAQFGVDYNSTDNSAPYQNNNGMMEDNDEVQGFEQDNEQFGSYRNNNRMISRNSRNAYNSNNSYDEDENYGQMNNSRTISRNSRNAYNSNNSYDEDEDYGQMNNSRTISRNSRNAYNSNNSYGEDEDYGQMNNSRMISRSNRNDYNNNNSYGEDENYGRINNNRMMSRNSRNAYNSNNSHDEDEDFEQGNVSNNMRAATNRTRRATTGQRTNNTSGSSIGVVKRGRVSSNNSVSGLTRRIERNRRTTQVDN